ncbi:uncharacterized protein LOC121711350 isoform X4 [Alosa sapidissima]|uniref:uncharacterized protein LOC121711350 isoform X4 n=1 Tax=Alosa sapidissima TaxID=34773 RepID=UPI001C09E2C9|nr:uncharacterized protein LOC121711350 isoform X4 [Alosa sapidissima]
MSSLVVIIIALLGVIQSALKVSGTEVNLMVKPGNNVTLYCDCTWTSGLHLYCYQPIWNSTSQSHDLLIKNITESELGLYYCSVAMTKLIDTTVIHQRVSHIYGNITYKLSFEDAASSPAPTCPPPPDGGQCWSLLVILCPVCTLLSALISSTCVYCFCRCKTAPVEPGERSKRRESRAGKQDEDKELCYASLDMPARAHKAKPKRTRNKTQNSDFSTYSEVRSYHV